MYFPSPAPLLPKSPQSPVPNPQSPIPNPQSPFSIPLQIFFVQVLSFHIVMGTLTYKDLTISTEIPLCINNINLDSGFVA
jgi:hypothetical protein